VAQALLSDHRSLLDIYDTNPPTYSLSLRLYKSLQMSHVSVHRDFGRYLFLSLGDARGLRIMPSSVAPRGPTLCHVWIISSISVRVQRALIRKPYKSLQTLHAS